MNGPHGQRNSMGQTQGLPNSPKFGGNSTSYFQKFASSQRDSLKNPIVLYFRILLQWKEQVKRF